MGEIPLQIKSNDRLHSQAVTKLYLPSLIFPGFGMAISEIAKSFTGRDNYFSPKSILLYLFLFNAVCNSFLLSWFIFIFTG